MAVYAGWDTSNYTTSAALVQAEREEVYAQGKLLPVKEGALGLRQSDAVFHHVRQLPEITTALFNTWTGEQPAAVGASERPCEENGSYMPCFLAGIGAAKELASVLHVPYYGFTHQQGHIMAALYGAKRMEWRRTRFLALHVSGGTTDLLLVQPHEDTVISCTRIARSLDLKAGQLIDRVGNMLGLPFPAGPTMEELAKKAGGVYRVRPSMEKESCHLSGVENRCLDRIRRGEPKEEVALFCLKSIEAALCGMITEARKKYGDLPLLCAGGVMANVQLKETLQNAFDGSFAPPSLSKDNAVGIAWLTRLRHEQAGGCI